jgi:DNA-binding XRE family transcriptional regulator
MTKKTRLQIRFNHDLLLRYLNEEQRTQKWLAQKSGVSEPTISKMVNYGTVPDITIAERLAPVLGCRPLELYVEVPVE